MCGFLNFGWLITPLVRTDGSVNSLRVLLSQLVDQGGTACDSPVRAPSVE